MGRQEDCPHCGASLHCCYNCRFYDPNAYNECHEPVAERVVAKESANFCDCFKFNCKGESCIRPQDRRVAETDEAKKKLEALFKK
ncbi:MAG: hypothetical protein Q7S00_02350 [bacterium]|nr:hypothetical protein [bacterium]